MSQFSAMDGKQTLAGYCKVPKDVYPVGRLDYDSEGLLLLTNDTQLNHRLLNPAFKHGREYWAQVEGLPTEAAIRQLEKGVNIGIDGKIYHTLPCKASFFAEDPGLAERNPPIRFRKNIPTTWLSLQLHEGKNRQVRKMTAAIGHPTLRLVRWRIGKINLEGMRPGELRRLERETVYRDLF